MQCVLIIHRGESRRGRSYNPTLVSGSSLQRSLLIGSEKVDELGRGRVRYGVYSRDAAVTPLANRLLPKIEISEWRAWCKLSWFHPDF